MKDLSIYFESIIDDDSYMAGQLGNQVLGVKDQQFIVPKKNSVAIFFVLDYRKTENKDDHLDWISDFRKSFFKLYAGNWKSEIVDLGVITPGKTIEDTYIAVKDVVAELVKNDVLPIVIGGGQDLTFPMYQAYEKLEQTINLMTVDPAFDLGDPDEEIDSEGWLSQILLHKPNFLFNFSLFGYQSYLVNPKEIELLNQLYFDAFRLGDFYRNEKMVEPHLRNTDILSFDLNAIRSSDYKGNSKHLPNGFYGEDACRIMRYAGFSDKLTSLGLFNFTPNNNGYQSDLNLLAQMIWYFIEGFNLRKKDYPIGSKSAYLKYRVNIDDFRDEIIFYKSNKSNRWWMEVPYPKLEGVKLQRHLLVPCDYEDYENALKSELPDLWLRTYKKLI